MIKKAVVLALAAALLFTGCGDGEMSLTEYVDRLNAIVDDARTRYEALVASPEGAVLVAEGEELNDFTPQDLQAALLEVHEIASGVEKAVADIEPPELVADIHHFWFDFDSGFALANVELAARAGTAQTWEELSESPEMANYRVTLAVDKQGCADFQAQLDATAERGVFAENPWLPGELKEVVSAVLGCEGYPEHPEDAYRPDS